MKLFDVLFQTAADAFFIADADTGRIIEANESAEKLTGFDRSELLQMHQSQLHPPAMLDHYRSLFASHARGNHTILNEAQIIRKDGSVVPIEVRGSSFEYEGRRLLFGIFRDTSDRDVLLRRAERSDKRNKTIAEFAPICIVVHCNGRVVYANASALKTLGAATSADLLHQNVLDLIHPDDVPAVRERIRAMTEKGGSAPMIEERLKRLTGDFFLAEVTATPIDWDGIPSVMVAFHDIDDRARRRNYREAILQLLQNSFRSVDANTWLLDLVKMHTHAFNASTGLLAIHDDQSGQRIIAEAPTPIVQLTEEAGNAEDASPSAFAIRNDTPLFIDNIQKLPVAESFRKRLAEYSVTSCWCQPVKNRDGKAIGSLTFYFADPRLPCGEEIEGLQQASYMTSVFIERSELLDENTVLSQVTLQTREGVVVTDVQRRVTYVNKAFTDVTGYTLEDVKGKNLRRIMQGPATSIATIQFMKEQLSQTKGFDCKVFNYRKNGEGFWNDLRIDPIFDRFGVHAGFIGLQRDVSEEEEARFELQKKLQETDEVARARSEFLSIISHEIRTPLNSISGIVHLLSDRSPREDQREEIDILKNSADQLQVLVNDVLDFGQIDAGTLSFQNRPLSFLRLMKEVCDSFAPSFVHTPVKFDYSIDSDIPDSLIADPARVRQVYAQLLSNAQKFTTSGTVRLQIIKSEEDADHIVLQSSVSDTGIGMTYDVASRVFEPFFKGNPSERHEGTGLGLSIAQSIVRHYGGEISVESRFGTGSTFRFALHLQKKGEPENPLKAMFHFKSAHILIVDDNETNILITRKFLELWEIQVDQALNGEEALYKVKNGQYDLILMDLQMPVMDGYEATRRIRLFDTKIPIVALTASAQDEVQAKVLEAGMNDLIVKPFHPADLNQKISHLIEKK